MIDIHTHILYGLDDGAPDYRTMHRMFSMAAQEGITCMIATPHCIANSGWYDLNMLLSRYKEAKELLDREEIPVKLYLGNELFLDEFALELVEKKEVFPLAESRYLLVEFPVTGIPEYGHGVLCSLVSRGFRPVIAHPERYSECQEDTGFFIPYIEMGCLLQLNTDSFQKDAGSRVQKAARKLVQSGMIHFLSTDCHSTRSRPPRYREVVALIEKLAGPEKLRQVTEENPRRVLEDSWVVVEKPVFS